MAKLGYLFSGAVAALLVASVTSAQEVTVSGGAVAGKILSGSVGDVSNNKTATIITVPENGRFVLTLICSGPLASEIPFYGSTFGFIAQTPPGAGSGTCQSLLPGVALNRGEDVTCTNTFGGTTNCQASGVLSRR